MVKKIELDCNKLNELYHTKKKSKKEIAKILQVSEDTVRRRMKECGIPDRSRSDLFCSSKGFLKSRKINNHLHQILDGILLSDGYYSNKKNIGEDTSYLVVTQSAEHYDWLTSIKKDLEKNKIKSSIRSTSSLQKGTKCDGFQLQSMSTLEFGKERKRWYDGNHKIVPKDIELTPIVLANWFMGDGSAKPEPNKSGKIFYRITLCTQGYSEKETIFLQQQLNKLYGYNVTKTKAGNGYNLRIGQYKYVNNFLYKTSPYKINCFDYKWKALTDPLYTLDRNKWASKALEYLKRYSQQGSNIPELIRMGFSPSAITQKANLLDFKLESVWNEENDNLIIEKFEENGTNIKGLIDQGISKDQIQKRAIKLGKKCKYIFNQFGKTLRENKEG